MTVKATKKSFSEKNEKTQKNTKKPIPKLIPIPTENRQFRKNTDPDPNRLPKVNPGPQGSTSWYKG
jgi:hypothetical protein